MKFTPNFEKPKDAPNELDVKKEQVSFEQVKEIFENLKVPADSLALSDMDRYKNLLEEKLPPQVKISFENFETYLSEVKKSSKKGRDFCIAYTKDNSGEYIPHTYFLSRSQGVWRSLNGIVFKEDNSIFHHKGQGEDSIFLPVALQKEMLAGRDLNTSEMVDKVAMYGGVEVVESTQDHLPKEYDENISEKPHRLFDEEIFAPEKVDVSAEKMPNFDNLVSEWSSSLSYHGEINIKVFNSKDKSLRYMFSQREDGKVWVSGIEIVSSRITSLGVRKDWIKSDSLTMSPYEYLRKDYKGYYNTEDTIEHGGDIYTDFYTNYLSKIPIIKEFNDKVD